MEYSKWSVDLEKRAKRVQVEVLESGTIVRSESLGRGLRLKTGLGGLELWPGIERGHGSALDEQSE